MAEPAVDYAYISFLTPRYIFLCLSLLHRYHQVSSKLGYRIENLLSVWLNMSGMTTISAFSWNSHYFPTLVWNLLPASAIQLSSETPPTSYGDAPPHHAGTPLHIFQGNVLASLLSWIAGLWPNPWFWWDTFLLSFLKKHAKASLWSLLGPKTNIQEIERMEENIGIVGTQSAKQSIHGQHDRSHNAVSSTNKF